MKFSVGLNGRFADEIISLVNEKSENISELYFSYPNFANARSPISDLDEKTFREKLKRVKCVSLNILFNAMCYGENALARDFYYKIGDLLEELSSEYNLETVTTTSPIIAKFVKNNFPNLKTRASVNMEIGSILGMEYILEFFDGFYAKRECNKNLEALKAMKKWCDKNGKKLYGLANSGCLNNCSAHTFHDNLVAHEYEISQKDNAYLFDSRCRAFLMKNADKWLSTSNFIRPEDVYIYEEIFKDLNFLPKTQWGYAPCLCGKKCDIACYKHLKGDF